jgi:hypothetical protein
LTSITETCGGGGAGGFADSLQPEKAAHMTSATMQRVTRRTSLRFAATEFIRTKDCLKRSGEHSVVRAERDRSTKRICSTEKSAS